MLDFSISTLSPSGPTFPGNPFLPIRPLKKVDIPQMKMIADT